MQNKFLQIIPAVVLLCALHASVALPKADDSVRSIALLLNGKTIDTRQLSGVSRGVISLSVNSKSSDKGQVIPFYIYLRRDGKIVDAQAYAHNYAVSHYDIAEVLKSARAGDELIIDPANQNDKTARRTIIVNNTQVVPQFNWLNGWIGKKDNC
nr:hypothetical protein [uncultured Dyadobacter sp.]